MICELCEVEDAEQKCKDCKLNMCNDCFLTHECDGDE
jgi:hypothetical protein